MGPIALFVVLVMFPVGALVLLGGALAVMGLAGAAASIPLVSWVGFAAGLLLGTGWLWARRS